MVFSINRKGWNNYGYGIEYLKLWVNKKKFPDIKQDLNLYIQKANFVYGKIDKEWSTKVNEFNSQHKRQIQ